MWQSFGHTANKQLLEKQLQKQVYPHAYLFVGPSGIGKKMVAQDLAAQILQAERLDTHPDFIFYDAGNDLGMDGLRDFLRLLGNKPFLGQYKIAVIDNMDQANVQMGNALLKTLEEPSPSTILIVIAGQNNLLPTIVSRCQVLQFNLLSKQELADYAKFKQLKVDDQSLAASFGSPARLQLVMNDPEVAASISLAVTQLMQAEQGATAEKLLAITGLAEYETEDLKNILLTWLYHLRQTLVQDPGRAALMRRLCEALPHLNNAFNKKMVLQRLLLGTL